MTVPLDSHLVAQYLTDHPHFFEEHASLLGDIKLTGSVNALDFGILAGSFGKTVTGGWEQGDLNYDGVVNADDFALLMLGAASQNGTISAGVPEPTTAALALLPLAAGCVSRRRRK